MSFLAYKTTEPSPATCYAARVNWTRYVHISWTIPVNCPRTIAIQPIGEAGAGIETRDCDNYPAGHAREAAFGL